MNTGEERQQEHCKQQWYPEQNCRALLELQCVGNMNENQNGCRLLNVANMNEAQIKCC
jgi:hypothetical protein